MQPLGKKGLFFRDFEAPSSPNDPFYQRACFFFGGGKVAFRGGGALTNAMMPGTRQERSCSLRDSPAGVELMNRFTNWNRS